MRKCAACQVLIEGDRVRLTKGGEISRERLWARVCQYAKLPGCINSVKIANVKDSDYYGDPAIAPLSQDALQGMVRDLGLGQG